MFTYLLQTHSFPAFTHLQQLFSGSSSDSPLFFTCDPDASCGSASADHPCFSAKRCPSSAKMFWRSSMLRVVFSSVRCIFRWLWWLWLSCVFRQIRKFNFIFPPIT